MTKKFQASIADTLIASDFLFSCQGIRSALREMKRYELFTARTPVRYWRTILRNLWLSLREITGNESLEEITLHSLPNRNDSYVALGPGLTHPLNSIIIFLVLTLHLSFICKMAALSERRGLHYVQKMPTLRNEERLQVLSC